MQHEVWGIVSGTEDKPQEAKAAAAWIARDHKAIGIIGQALTTSVEISSNATKANTSKELWGKLQIAYGKSTTQSKFMLRIKLDTIQLQENGDVNKYLADFTAWVQELKSTGFTISNDEITLRMIHGLPLSWSSFSSSLFAQPDDTLTPSFVTARVRTEVSRPDSRG